MSWRYRLCQRFIGHRWGRLRFDSLFHMWGRECRYCKAWEYPAEQPSTSPQRTIRPDEYADA